MANEFDIKLLREAITHGRIRWQLHALERLLEREISRAEVLQAVLNGEIIEEYMTDRPLPSCLIAHAEAQPLHVVAAVDKNTGAGHIITAYRPDQKHFEADHKTRRRRT